jgi:hypothetical protein
MTEFYVIMQKRQDGKVYADLHKSTQQIYLTADIQKIEEEVKKKERQKVLDKLTQRERELLGV